MKNRYLKTIALLLVCVLTIGVLPAFAVDFEMPEDNFNVDFELPEDDFLQEPEIIINATYAGSVTDDDTISDGEGWLLNEQIGAHTMDVQWDTDNLYIAANKTSTVGGVTFAITVKGVTKSDNYSRENASGIKELVVPLSELGISVADYSTRIPAEIVIGGTIWKGVIVLTSTKWEHTTDSNMPDIWVGRPTYVHGGKDVPNRRYSEKIDKGLHLYDLFDSDDESKNYGGARIHASWNNLNAYNYCEFDMQIDSLPVYKLGLSSTVDYKYAVFGINWWMAGEETLVNDVLKNSGYGASMGIVNTEDGLVFVLRSNGPDQYVRLNKFLGTNGITLRLATRLEADNSLTLFMDGVKLANLKNARMYLKTGTNKLEFISHRSDDPAASAADNIDVSIRNIAVGNSRGDHLVERLTFDDFKGENKSLVTISSKLTLPTTLEDDRLSGKITWSSSDASVINPQTGDVVRPAKNNKAVELTATCNGASKKFTLMVFGRAPEGNVMFVENDLKTATGAGVRTLDRPTFTLDQYNSSIIYNQHAVQKVNVIELIDSDAVNRLNESVLTIWYSNDNVTYTQLDEYFKILRKGNKTYLYDFEIEAQYIKVHCTHYSIYEADFTNVLQNMIRVHYMEMPFNTTSQVIIENDTGKAVYDQPYTVTLENSGALCLKTDYSDVRFYLGGELLYHYFDGERFVVRVPHIAAYGVVKLEVQSGNVNAADISNKEYVYEVVYGTRESCDETYVAFSADAKREDKYVPQNELPKYLVSLPGGVMWGFRGYYNGFYYKTSYDGGVSWSNNYLNESETTTVSAADGIINDVRGAIYDDFNDDDPETGRLLINGRIPEPIIGEDGNPVTDKNGKVLTRQRWNFMYTSNLKPGNKNDWEVCAPIMHAGTNVSVFDEDRYFSMDTYSKPVKVSSYDGAGANVDFVVPVCVGQYTDENGEKHGMISSVYSADGGMTWYLSRYRIKAEPGVIAHNAENGLSEANLLEDDNGRLVILSRYQYGNTVNFATIYSYDFGISWTTESKQPEANPEGIVEVMAKTSTVYSANTQPCMIELGGNNMLFWGGNNVLGGSSYMRNPLSIAVSYDMDKFVNIQDAFSRYSMQGMTMGDRMSVTNQSVDSSIEDRVAMIWYDDAGDQSLVIDNFTDYFYRSKGAYDSFENSTVKYEGWSSVYGNASVSCAQSTDGRYSMMIPGGVSVVRSVSYLQNGKIAFDLYLEDAGNAKAEIEFESAYGTEYGKAAPIAFKIEGGKLYFRNANGEDAEVAATLVDKWNHFEFDLALLADAPSAKLSVNRGEAVELPIDLDIGDYICYVDIATGHGTNYYVDSFLVQDQDQVRVPSQGNEPKFYGNSILLGKNYAVNYYVEKSLFASGAYKDPYVVFELNGTETKVDTYKESGDYYIFTFSNLAPDMLVEHIYATLHATAADGSEFAGDTTWYSVAKYCYNQLASNKTSAELRTLLVDLLNYGAASQIYRNENAEGLANADLTEEQREWGSKDFDKLTDNKRFGDMENPTVQWKAVSLWLQDSIVIRMYFTANDITGLTIQAEGAGKTWTIPASSFKKDDQGRYYADFGRLNPAQMREVISFTVYDEDTPVSITFQYSIESYVYSKYQNPESPDALKALVIRMIMYGDATKKYVDSLSAK